MKSFLVTETQLKQISALVAEIPVKYSYSLVQLLVAIEQAEIKEKENEQ